MPSDDHRRAHGLSVDGATAWTPSYLSYLAKAYAELGQFDEAWRSIGEATTMIETTGERWWEADIHRLAGEIALVAPQRDAAKALACFEQALAVARAQQAKSWELRAAMSIARLYRDQGKRQQARDLLAPVYGWFSEGFDTLDLKEAEDFARRTGRMRFSKFRTLGLALVRSRIGRDRPNLPAVELPGR